MQVKDTYEEISQKKPHGTCCISTLRAIAFAALSLRWRDRRIPGRRRSGRHCRSRLKRCSRITFWRIRCAGTFRFWRPTYWRARHAVARFGDRLRIHCCAVSPAPVLRPTGDTGYFQNARFLSIEQAKRFSSRWSWHCQGADVRHCAGRGEIFSPRRAESFARRPWSCSKPDAAVGQNKPQTAK